MGWLLTAVIGSGASLWERGSECREAKHSEMQEIVAPESTSVNVRRGFCRGRCNVTLMKKWFVLDRECDTCMERQKIGALVRRGTQDPDMVLMWVLVVELRDKGKDVPFASGGSGTFSEPPAWLFPAGKS